MSNCDCQENIKKPFEDGPTTDNEKSIGDGPLITTIAAATVGIFFSLRAMGLVQHDVLLMSASFVWLMSLAEW